MSVQILSPGPARGHRVVVLARRECIDTGRVVIGSCHIARPPIATRDGETLQAALLEPRTAQPRPLLTRVAGFLWSLA